MSALTYVPHGRATAVACAHPRTHGSRAGQTSLALRLAGQQGRGHPRLCRAVRDSGTKRGLTLAHGRHIRRGRRGRRCSCGVLAARRFPTLDPTRLANYVAAEEEFTRLTVTDTLEIMLNEGTLLLRRKAIGLRVALMALTVAAILLGAGILSGST
jgi:hypothetical protein